MRVVTLCAVQALLLTAAAAAMDPTPTDRADPVPPKPAPAVAATRPAPVQPEVGGDTMATAIPIRGPFFTDSGNTCGFHDDYDAVCPYRLPGAPDVVYSFTPPGDTVISVDLCASLYDTKLYIFADSPGNVVACSDDACGTGLPGAWQSRLDAVVLDAGRTYYLVVDGYSPFDCGTYYLNVTERKCVVFCPAGALIESEPRCADQYDDVFNGGCNSDPPVFTTLPCSNFIETVCGEYGGFLYNGMSYRDTDWYEITVRSGHEQTITWSAVGLLDTIVGIIDGRAGCPVNAFHDYATGPCAAPPSVTATLPSGRWWLFVAPNGFGPGIGSCHSPYTATLTGYACGPTAVDAGTWGRIKGAWR